MSIINEALKKAVREKESSFTPQEKETVRRNIEIEFQKKGSRMNWGPVFVLLALVLITGPIVAPMFSTPVKENNAASGLSAQPRSQNIPAQSSDIASAAVNSDGSASRKAQFGIEEAPLFGSMPIQTLSGLPQLNLSGVVYSPEESYCIINDKIVRIGDMVHGAKLVSVSQTKVVLDYRGKEIMLSVGSE